MVLECLVELEHVFIDKLFTYKIPDELLGKVKVGMRINVPFGHQNLEGFVLAIHKEDENQTDLKFINSLVDDYPILNEELINLGKYIKDTTLSSLMSAYQVMLPKALKAKKKVHIPIKTEKYISLNKDINLDNEKLNPTQKTIINTLKDKKEVKKQELESISKSSIQTLIKKNILIVTEKEVSRLTIKSEIKKDFNLNEEQQKVYNEVKQNLGKNETFLF